MSKKPAKPTTYPEFLKDLLEAKSPTGHEFAAQKVIDDHVEKSADKYSKTPSATASRSSRATAAPP